MQQVYRRTPLGKYKDLQRYEKETPTQVFSCEYCKVFKNNYFEEHLRAIASVTRGRMG